MLVLNLNIPKTKSGGAEEHAINNFYKLIAEHFEYALKSAHRFILFSLLVITKYHQKHVCIIIINET